MSDEPPSRRPVPVVLMTVSEVARMLRVSNMTVHRLVQRGELEGLWLGRSLRISTRSVKAILGDWWPGDPTPHRSGPPGRRRPDS